MSKSLFFNALPDATSETGYDRNYNADDLSDFLSIVCDTGVVKTNISNGEPVGLKVMADVGLSVGVIVGKAVIKGKAFISDTIEFFTLEPNGTTLPRYDYIVIKYDNNVTARNITLELRKGDEWEPALRILSRTDKVYELMLAYIEVAPNTTQIHQTDITDTRGKDECPWFTAVKGYDEYYDAIIQTHESTIALTSSSNTVITDLPSNLYNERYSLVEVYTNGIKEPQTAYNVLVSGGYIVITFNGVKASGTNVTVKLDNFIDGEGMSTALKQYNKLVQDITDLKAAKEYDYICNGVNDNILISNLVKLYLSGGEDYGCARFNIIGNIGMSTPAVGGGTTASPYGWFDFESNYPTRKAIIDFSRCASIEPPITNGTYNIIFNGRYINIEYANVVAQNTTSGTTIKVFGVGIGEIRADNCRFYITCYQDATISYIGTFNNCRGSITNLYNNTFCFIPHTNGLLRVNGGEYYAYTADNSKISALVGQNGADAVSILYGVNMPTNARGGYYQTHSIYQYAGGGVISCTDLVSALPLSVISGLNNTRGTIVKSKAGYM